MIREVKDKIKNKVNNHKIAVLFFFVFISLSLEEIPDLKRIRP
jgi:hypothetical protein